MYPGVCAIYPRYSKIFLKFTQYLVFRQTLRRMWGKLSMGRVNWQALLLLIVPAA